MPAGAEAVEAVSEILDRAAAGGIAVDEPVPPDEAFGQPAPRDPGPRADHLVKAYVLDDAEAPGRIVRVREALGHLQAFGLGPLGELGVRPIDDADWLEAWKATFKPIRIGAFLVRPTWSDAAGDAGAIPLVLDPGMAFGTGLHPTTQQCLRWLSSAELAGRSLLDVGCGSGILAIGAAKRGAGPVAGVDTDPLAVDASRENAAANGVTLPVAVGSAADVQGVFDVVLANIVAPVLQRIAPDLGARLAAGGTLVVAGVIEPAAPAVIAALAAAGLEVVERTQSDDWVSLVFRRS